MGDRTHGQGKKSRATYQFKPPCSALLCTALLCSALLCFCLPCRSPCARGWSPASPSPPGRGCTARTTRACCLAGVTWVSRQVGDGGKSAGGISAPQCNKRASTKKGLLRGPSPISTTAAAKIIRRQEDAPVEVGEAPDGRDHVHGLVHHRHRRRAQRRA